MVLAVWQRTITDNAGNALPAAMVEVRAERAGSPLAVIYSDRAGTVPLANPFPADSTGFAQFFTGGGAYKITATLGSSTNTWRYVPIGLSQESDSVATGVRYRFASSTADADPGTGTFRFNNATLASVTSIFVDLTSDDGIDMTTWLDSLDDGGSSSDRGIIQIDQSGNGAFFIGRVTGSIAAPSGYRKIVVTPLATVGTFVVGSLTSIGFFRAGVDATGDVNGPASAVSGNLATFNGTTGKLIADGGKSITSVGAGKQTIWVPASAMVPTSGAAGPTLQVLAINQLTMAHLLFDPVGFESAHFQVPMPKGWNVGQFSFQAVWSHAATTVNFGVMWQLTSVSLSDDDSITTAIADGAAQADTGGTTDDLYISPESTPFSLASPAGAANDVQFFRAGRLVADAADTLAIDARLLGFKIFYTTSANTDN